LRDEQTSSWWQQATGEAILGPLKGQRLRPVFHDELTFGAWKRENPDGRVLQPIAEVAWMGKYYPSNWEEWIGTRPVVTPARLLRSGSTGASSLLPPRTIIIGIVVNGAAKAYPFSAVQQARVVNDTVGGVPIVVVLGDDKKSVRAFARTERTDQAAGNGALVLEPSSGTANAPSANGPVGAVMRFVDSKSRTVVAAWNFQGKRIAPSGSGAKRIGPEQLPKVPVVKEYWFNWKTYHPSTAVFESPAQVP
jgi:hypothetical protein